MRHTFLALGAALLAGGPGPAAEPLKPPEVWRDYDPDRGEWREEVVRQETAGGVLSRDTYISAYVLDQEIRVYCQYRVQAGATGAPGLLDVHGWMGAPSPSREFVTNGWAVLAFDYCGKVAGRAHYTRYPESLRHGNMDAQAGPSISTRITDVKQSSDYLWYALQSRALSYLARQREVDRTRLGAKGYSYGGTLMWPLATDPRVKAVVAYFGIGWTAYWRDKQVWMYNVPYVEPPRSPGETIFLEGLAPEAYVPYIKAATLHLNGSNDHHGGHERGLESFKRFAPGVPWSFAVQARGHHNTERIGQDAALWLDKHVLGKDVFWPAHPRAALRLDREGVPELVVTPASVARVTKVEAWYALKSPASFARSWRDTACVRQGDDWVAKLPVLNVADYVFGFANVTYDNTVVVSTDFNAAIPAKLGAARATDQRTDAITGAAGGLAAWTNVAPVEGPGGVQGFRAVDSRQGCGTEQLADPKWQAPPGSRLGLRFYCTQPVTLILTAGDHYEGEVEFTACDQWQEMAIGPEKLRFRFNQRPLQSWSEIGKIALRPKAGADISKVIFADLRWVGGGGR